MLGYDADHTRIAGTDDAGGRTVYINPRLDMGGHYEKETKGGVDTHKSYIYAGNEVVAIYTSRSNGVNDTRYLHTDNLGSIDTITDEAGQVVERLSYDAFGKRRNPDGTDAAGILT